MVIDHADRLHVCVNDRRSHKSKPPDFQVLTEQLGFLRYGRDLAHLLPPIEDGFVSDKLPDVSVEAYEFFLHFQESLRVVDRGADLEFIADDIRVLQQALEIRFGIAGNLLRDKIRKCPPVPCAPFQDGRPTETGLRALQHQEFKVLLVVVYRHTPFIVVVCVKLRVLCPLASGNHTQIITVMIGGLFHHFNAILAFFPGQIKRYVGGLTREMVMTKTYSSV